MLWMVGKMDKLCWMKEEGESWGRKRKERERNMNLQER